MRKKLTAYVVTALGFLFLCAFTEPAADKSQYYMTLASDIPSNISSEADAATNAYNNESYIIMNQTQQYEVNVINEINNLRISSGMEPLTVDPELMNAAAIRCAEISVSYSHVRPDQTDCFTAYPASYGWAGENIAYGYQTPEDVMLAWSDSSKHLANMTKPQYKYIGVGVYTSPDGISYWVQCFGG